MKEALGSVIPAGVIWGGQAGEVFKKLKDDFMVPPPPPPPRVLTPLLGPATRFRYQQWIDQSGVWRCRKT